MFIFFIKIRKFMKFFRKIRKILKFLRKLEIFFFWIFRKSQKNKKNICNFYEKKFDRLEKFLHFDENEKKKIF